MDDISSIRNTPGLCWPRTGKSNKENNQKTIQSLDVKFLNDSEEMFHANVSKVFCLRAVASSEHVAV